MPQRPPRRLPSFWLGEMQNRRFAGGVKWHHHWQCVFARWPKAFDRCTLPVMPPRFDPESFRRKVFAERDRLAPLLPEIDPADLLLILECTLRPFGTGKRFFLRQRPDGRYGP